MVRGVGVHVVSVSRLARALARGGERLERRLFGAGELADCADRRDRTTALAARLAAKGACIRALGAAWSAVLTPDQVEIRRGAGGRPELLLRDALSALCDRRGVSRKQVSLTHDAGLALAVVILEE